jgi:GNAT superfamily N-acetyltransferase
VTWREADVLRRMCDTIEGYLELGNETFEASGATFVRNRACPLRYDANHVASVTCETPEEIDALLSRMDLEFGEQRHRTLKTDVFTAPEVGARLSAAGFRLETVVQLLFEGELRAPPKECDIRPVLTDEDWAAYDVLQALNWSEHGNDTTGPVLEHFTMSKRAKTPAVTYWLAYVDDAPRGFFSAWAGGNGVGIVEDLFTQKEYRHRGIATALIAHAVSAARGDGAQSVIIGADAGDTPKTMYAAMGFRPMMLTQSYLRTFD